MSIGPALTTGETSNVKGSGAVVGCLSAVLVAIIGGIFSLAAAGKLPLPWERPTPTAVVRGPTPVGPGNPTPSKLSNLTINFHTNDEDKDDDTGLQVRVGTVAEWRQVGKEKYP